LGGSDLLETLYDLRGITTNIYMVIHRNRVVAIIAYAFDPIFANGDLMVASEALYSISTYIVVLILSDAYPFVIANLSTAVVTYFYLLVMLDLLTAIVADEDAVVVFDMNVLVFLGMNKHFLLPQLIFKTQLIETRALMGTALDGHPRLVLGQLIRRQVGFAVSAACGDRLIRVTA
jgi:hypothetical protein